MFEKFGEVLYEAGQYKIEEVSIWKSYLARRHHPEKHEKWCRVLYKVEVIDDGASIVSIVCECGNFEHTGLLCCHALNVLDVLGMDQIPAKQILKRWTKDARNVLPDHLVHLQKDKINVNSITFRHSNLYTHALEVVRLGDANTWTYECAMEILKKAMDTLTPMASVRDGMGLEDRIHSDKGKDKELIPMHAAESHEDSDAEGSAVGNFIGLKPPERKLKPGRPTTSRDKPPYDDPGAKSKKFKDATNGKAPDGSGTSKRTHLCSICRGAGHKSTACPQRGDLPRKEREEAKCSNCGVGGHKKNTCNKPKVVLHVVENATLEQISI
ncbi:uncharacterized protein [Aegilops tauschii subsp. strangulata]|nr:uncharacterized protein LOC109737253 [Aegilops tauschii subsp. strangulata]